MIGKKI